MKDLLKSNPQAMGGGSGGLDLAKSLVEKALGKNAGGTLENVRQQIEAMPFGFLQKVDSQHLLTFIMDEHPQTIALILANPLAAFTMEDDQRMLIDMGLATVFLCGCLLSAFIATMRS